MTKWILQRKVTSFCLAFYEKRECKAKAFLPLGNVCDVSSAYLLDCLRMCETGVCCSTEFLSGLENSKFISPATEDKISSALLRHLMKWWLITVDCKKYSSQLQLATTRTKWTINLTFSVSHCAHRIPTSLLVNACKHEMGLNPCARIRLYFSWLFIYVCVCVCVCGRIYCTGMLDVAGSNASLLLHKQRQSFHIMIFCTGKNYATNAI